MPGYTVLKMEVRNGALVARVRYEAPDGRAKEAQYGWPATITRAEVEAILEKFYADFLAEPAQPAAIHEAMDLVGKPVDVGPQ